MACQTRVLEGSLWLFAQGMKEQYEAGGMRPGGAHGEWRPGEAGTRLEQRLRRTEKEHAGEESESQN